MRQGEDRGSLIVQTWSRGSGGCYSLEIEKPRVTGGDCAVFRNNERSIMETLTFTVPYCYFTQMLTFKTKYLISWISPEDVKKVFAVEKRKKTKRCL